MNLSVIQYDVIMEAINQAKQTIRDENFIDLYCNEENYNHVQLMEALLQVENKLIHANTPL